jgi:hypothetical protein
VLSVTVNAAAKIITPTVSVKESGLNSSSYPLVERESRYERPRCLCALGRAISGAIVDNEDISFRKLVAYFADNIADSSLFVESRNDDENAHAQNYAVSVLTHPSFVLVLTDTLPQNRQRQQRQA